MVKTDYFAELAIPGVPGLTPTTGGSAKPSGERMSPVSPVPPVKESRAEREQAKKLIEVIKWLKPCPICFDMGFIERRQGGFFCVECQPTPPEDALRFVKAPGKIVRASGYGCGKCGHNVYRQIPDGWLCENCKMVFLVIGGTRGPKLIQ